MIDKVELKVENYIDEKYTELSLKRKAFEEEIKEGRLEIESLEKQKKELEEKKDEAFDVFQAISVEEDPVAEERKYIEEKIEELYTKNTDSIASIKKIDKEIKRINEIKDELSVIKKKIVINDLKEEETTQVISKEDLLKETSHKDNADETKDDSDKQEKEDVLETVESESKESQDKNDKVDVDEEKASNIEKDTVETDKEEKDNKDNKDNKENKDNTECQKDNNTIKPGERKIIVDRLKFVHSIIGKDNNRASTTLLQVINKISGK